MPTWRKTLILMILGISLICFLWPISQSTDSETIYIREMGRVSFKLFNTLQDPSDVVGYQIINGKQVNLPIGSTLNKKEAIFNWMPGPGFLGKHELYFKSEQLGMEKKLSVFISPKFGDAKKLRITRDISLQATSNQPFGSFDTPIDGSTVQSSIAVTGWALDDVGVKNVKLYRKKGISQVYIGDAVFVAGARPDVAAAYPGYPNNTRAGWGYMLLTNFLPNGGNGTFTLLAIATDSEGHQEILGTKTIKVDNKNAVKPFGAIDTPTQGGSASGSSFVNWGWVLTPQPNSIPTDGSTINVWVDGVNLGHPEYNLYRSDIANKFPGYANSGGAIGYFYLDTTAYAGGVHTIQWTATDSAGNTNGIGSRYFAIKPSNAKGTETEVLSETTTSSVTNVSSDGNTITFDSDNKDVSQLEAGDYIVGGVSNNFPYGVLKEITNVNSTGSSYVVNTQTASVEEVIKDADISKTVQLTTADLMIARSADGAYLKSSSSSAEFSLQMNSVVLYDLDGNLSTTNDQVKLDGEIKFSPEMEISMRIENWQLKKFRTIFTFTKSVEVIANADFNFNLINKSKTLFQAYHNPIVFMVGAVPVVITPKIEIIAGIKGEATVSFEFGAGAGIKSTVGVQYKNGNWTKIKSLEKNFYQIGPTLNADLNVKGQIGPKFSLLFYGVTGPYFNVNAYGELNADLNDDPWWRLYGGFNVVGGVSINVLSHQLADYSFEIYDYKVELANSKGTDKYTLTVNKGTGVNGTPGSGSTTHSYGDNVNYSYSLKGGYTNLVVKLDGKVVSKSGTITMDKDHTLTATAQQIDIRGLRIIFLYGWCDYPETLEDAHFTGSLSGGNVTFDAYYYWEGTWTLTGNTIKIVVPNVYCDLGITATLTLNGTIDSNYKMNGTWTFSGNSGNWNNY